MASVSLTRRSGSPDISEIVILLYKYCKTKDPEKKKIFCLLLSISVNCSFRLNYDKSLPRCLSLYSQYFLRRSYPSKTNKPGGKGGNKVREERTSWHFCDCQSCLVLDFENKFFPYF